MTNLSHKDEKYFINGSVYNCPFCNRRNVRYTVQESGSFSWSNTRTIWFYLVECSEEECRKTSFHLSDHDLKVKNLQFSDPPQTVRKKFLDGAGMGYSENSEKILAEDGKPAELDDLFFFHQPTSHFTIDSRIPNSMRKPLSEADNCLKSGFLTGASGCLRKTIYKLLKEYQIPESNGSTKNYSYTQRIDLLKNKHTHIDGELFNNLKAVHGLTSQELHENDWEDLNSHTLRFLLEVIREILIELYVIPDDKKMRHAKIAHLKSESAKPKASATKKAP